MIQERMVSDTETPSNMKMKGVFKDGSQISGHCANLSLIHISEPTRH